MLLFKLEFDFLIWKLNHIDKGFINKTKLIIDTIEDRANSIYLDNWPANFKKENQNIVNKLYFIEVFCIFNKTKLDNKLKNKIAHTWFAIKNNFEVFPILLVRYYHCDGRHYNPTTVVVPT